MMKIRDLTEKEQILYNELIYQINIFVEAKFNKTNLINILDALIEEVMKNDQEGKAED